LVAGCTHEVGHAVAALKLSIPVNLATIVERLHMRRDTYGAQ
jgi:hypothetical protein